MCGGCLNCMAAAFVLLIVECGVFLGFALWVKSCMPCVLMKFGLPFYAVSLSALHVCVGGCWMAYVWDRARAATPEKSDGGKLVYNLETTPLLWMADASRGCSAGDDDNSKKRVCAGTYHGVHGVGAGGGAVDAVVPEDNHVVGVVCGDFVAEGAEVVDDFSLHDGGLAEFGGIEADCDVGAGTCEHNGCSGCGDGGGLADLAGSDDTVVSAVGLDAEVVEVDLAIDDVFLDGDDLGEGTGNTVL